VIVSFGDNRTAAVWRRERVSSIGNDLQRSVLRKLLILDAAENLNDLRSPPGNRLEMLSGSRQGQYSIRVNRQFRICFRWATSGPVEVLMVAYH
jgi:proteic killer suppression protein